MLIANCGDSRLIVSFNKGKVIKSLTRDHKPQDEEERKRILNNGGSIIVNSFSCYYGILGKTLNKQIHRIIPGRLSVSRAFGDASSKLPSLGGKLGVLMVEPEITELY